MGCQAQKELVVRSYGLEMHIRIDDHDLWMSDDIRFPTQQVAENYARMLIRTRLVFVGYRVTVSSRRPNILWFVPGDV